MKLYFLRHGQAAWPDWQGADDDRPLTKAGRKEMRAAAEFFAGLKFKPNAIVSSPLPRAYQTADLLAEALGLTTVQEELLAPGFDTRKLSKLLAKYAEQDLVLVGHEPDFSSLIRALTGAEIKMAKAGLARVDVGDSKQLHGTLVWLIPPRVSAK